MLFRSKKPTFSISIASEAVESIFDECDKYDADETGGRLLGTYREEHGHYDIRVSHVLEPGPNARRSATSFFQDSEYQEKMFRAIEAEQPEIEHLGNWHTHHVNGYPTLSGGDKTTYFNTVNHKKYNIDLFYALLVVSKNIGEPRYAVKHFVFRRDDNTVYEIPATQVRLVNAPSPRTSERETNETPKACKDEPQAAPNPERAKDQDFFAEFYPHLKPFLSTSAGVPYWKGPLSLVDGSRAEVVAMENPAGRQLSYSIAYSCKNPVIVETLTRYRERQFRSARHAVINLERDLNQALYRGKAR
jgi:hypothetical protein